MKVPKSRIRALSDMRDSLPITGFAEGVAMMGEGHGTRT